MGDDLMLEVSPCPMCAHDHAHAAYQFSPYIVAKCSRCGFFFLSPRLKEESMLKYYQDDNYYHSPEFGYTSYLEQERALRITFTAFLQNLKQRNLTGGSLLEVGCGYGYFLEEAKDYYSLRVGTDFSPKAVEKASLIADHVYLGGTEQIPEEMKFNHVVAINVIEHVYDPRSFIQDLYHRAKPGGNIILATPNINSFIRFLMGQKWPSFKIPEHILYFNQKSLFRLMKESGMKNIASIPFPHAFPATLIASKFSVRLPEHFCKYNIWVPTTMVAAHGTF